MIAVLLLVGLLRFMEAANNAPLCDRDPLMLDERAKCTAIAKARRDE